MSDCSTEAMKPKEPPKTCGTCYWMMMQPGHGECGACGNPECGLERWPEAYGNGYYLYTTVDGDCEGKFWKPRTDTIEQCYKQLGKLAKEMMHRIEYLELKYDAPTTSITARMYQQLDALGVSVDD